MSDTALWTWSELSEAMLQPSSSGPNIHGVSIDTRTLNRGDLFIALSGKARPEFNILTESGRDGHDFVMSAFENGATAALVHKPLESDNRVITCSETLQGLWDLARFRREQLSCPVIAVTGSSGKTTFKQFLQQALDVPSTSGSLNNHIGVPLSMARTARDAAAAVYELGTNHPGEIERLSLLVHPTIAVVLNVLNAHIGNFENHVMLCREKLSIAKGLAANGHFIVEESLSELATRQYPQARITTFGSSTDATVHYEWCGKDRITLTTASSHFEVAVPGGGEHRAMTLCATAATLDVQANTMSSLDKVSAELPPGRGQVFESDGITIIDESYNANPDSMVKCLNHLAQQPGQRRIAIVGTMNELGKETEPLHAALVPHLNQLDGVISVGQPMNDFAYQAVQEQKQWQAFETTENLLEYCAKVLRQGDTVLVKGSNTIFWSIDFVQALVTALQNTQSST